MLPASDSPHRFARSDARKNAGLGQIRGIPGRHPRLCAPDPGSVPGRSPGPPDRAGCELSRSGRRSRLRSRCSGQRRRKPGHLVERQRLGDVIALRGVALGLDAPGQVLGGLDALDDDRQPERAAQLRDRGHHRSRAAWVSKSSSEWSILRASASEADQEAQRGVAGAEVVDRDPHAELAQPVQLGGHPVRVRQLGALGDLQDERRAGQAALPQRLRHVVDQPPLSTCCSDTLTAIARCPQPGICSRQIRTASAGPAQHLVADLDDRPRTPRRSARTGRPAPASRPGAATGPTPPATAAGTSSGR